MILYCNCGKINERGGNMRLILDRIVENRQGEKTAVFESNDCMVEISENDMPSGFIKQLTYGIIIEARLVDGKLIDPILLTNETEKKLDANRQRLNRLRNRNK